MPFDVAGARAAGYSPEEILQHLGRTRQIDVNAWDGDIEHKIQAALFAGDVGRRQAPVDSSITPFAGRVGKAQPGLLEPGNIDLHKRPVVRNPDGSISTVRSASFNVDGREVLVPTVSEDGRRILKDKEALQQYLRTGKHLGMFATPQAATAYAEQLHKQQEQEYVPQGMSTPGNYAIPGAAGRAPAPSARLQRPVGAPYPLAPPAPGDVPPQPRTMGGAMQEIFPEPYAGPQYTGGPVLDPEELTPTPTSAAIDIGMAALPPGVRIIGKGMRAIKGAKAAKELVKAEQTLAGLVKRTPRDPGRFSKELVHEPELSDIRLKGGDLGYMEELGFNHAAEEAISPQMARRRFEQMIKEDETGELSPARFVGGIETRTPTKEMFDAYLKGIKDHIRWMETGSVDPVPKVVDVPGGTIQKAMNESPVDLSKARVTLSGLAENMPFSTKNPRTMTTSEINRELEEMDRLRETLVTTIQEEFKAQGGDPANLVALQQSMGSDPRWKALIGRRRSIMEEVAKEKAGGVSQRLPSGYERKKMLKEPPVK